MKKHNFSAGPCILPEEVFQQASQAILDFDNSGLSILEISHRSTAFVNVMEEARELALELLNLQNKGYKALFLHGGASMQFLMTAYNLLNKKAVYLNTGTWSSKAIKEAKLFGEVIEVASSKDKNFSYIPKDYSVNEDVDYFHCTSNNTIFGTQIKSFPKVSVPMICDMSSDIFSRELDFSQFDVIYAGAQKNMGPAGATLVAIKEEVLGRMERDIPSMMDYKVHIEKESMFNTPPVYAVYVSLLTLRWIKANGGIKAMERKNSEKAGLIYNEIDRNPLFKGFAAVEDRSAMNATFNLTDESKQEIFDKMWKKANVNGLSGHRSVGGYRASMYNALSLESVQVVVDVMQELEKKA
ncbi:3-phosphoserine/phosphohydroxythreonine transaminase [Autumnicola musiva]|uniref:Phosphoserine aminotransferase n=1 Tax=Autumnicola musiva TaxID=3075589 RepID=A0ABU3D5N2_9FLAO|nr:3-phosphoserine/phosphohydroxythreonine transaminase [Zunongwangia sp. F117]MDT0676846.1 3-phosphoserine/phosphohydroxythreonine transaminase [Zunongwangia sp. F117]